MSSKGERINLMKPAEHNVDRQRSNFLIRTPSALARRTFFYLLRVGEFVYEPGYELERTTLESFLIVYVLKGEITIKHANGTSVCDAEKFCIVDCYAPHTYQVSEETQTIWLHFDGPMARAYYEYIVDKLGNTFSLRTPTNVVNRLRTIMEISRVQSGFSEGYMSKLITDVLTEFVCEPDSIEYRQSSVVEDTLAYISNHLYEPLSIADLAARVYLSEYHFIRVFKKETGVTPHAYVLDSRLHAAQYLLAHSDLPLRAICEECGFSSSSVLCASFKKMHGMSPLEYRNEYKKS